MTELFEQNHEKWLATIMANPRNLASESELREQAKVALRRFLAADIDNSLSLEFAELQRLCDAMGLPMEADEEEALIKMDTDGNGTLDIEEWVLWWLRRVSTAPNPLKQAEAIARNTFQQFDADASGYLSISELTSLLHTLGADFTETEMAMALDEMDSDHTGVIEMNEFISWWTNRSQRNTSLISLKLRKLAVKAQKQFHSDIFTASWRGEVDFVKSFLDAEPRLCNASDESEYGEGWSPLQYAAYRGHLKIVQLLVDGKANVNQTNANGFTALFYACQQHHEDIVEVLLSNGADPCLYGSHPDDEGLFLSAVDFMADFPSLKSMFASHRKCIAPEALTDVTASLAAGQITLMVSQRKSANLLHKAYRVQLTAVPNDILKGYFNNLTTEIVIAAKIPGSTSAMVVNLDSSWWEQLTSGFYLNKINTLRCTGTATPQTVKELCGVLSIHYNALDLRKRKVTNLEDKLYEAILRTASEGESLETGSSDAQAVVAQIKSAVQGLRDSAAKAIPVQDLLTEAINSLQAKKAPEKRGNPFAPKTAKDTKSAKDGEEPASSAASVAKTSGVTSSNRAPWAVQMTISPLNAFKEGPATQGLPVKVAFIKL